MKHYKTVIIGSGPAGLMAATTLKSNCLILEKNATLGGKIKVSGGGRCNITNKKNIPFLIENIPHNNKFLFSSLQSYGPDNIIEFLTTNGVSLHEESDNKIFPNSNDATEIINLFEKLLKRQKKEIKTNYCVKQIEHDGSLFTINQEFKTEKLIIATGGITYKHLGTTGYGYEVAKQFGHSIITPYPVETPLVSNSDLIASKQLQGISLQNIFGELYVGKKKVFSKQHDILFTHFGLSGPLALQSSYFVNKALRANKGPINLHLTLNETDIPKKIKPFIDEQNKIIIPINDLRGTKYAFVTTGGVNVKELNPKTFESKLVKNLFFIGEVIDVNAFTGGYNITYCLSSGYNCADKINQNVN